MKHRNKLILLILLIINVGLGAYLYFVNPFAAFITDYTNLYYTFLIVLIILVGLINSKKTKYVIPIYHFTFLYTVFLYLNAYQVFSSLELVQNSLLIHGILLFILSVGYLLLLGTNKLQTFVSKVSLSAITLGVIGSGVYFSLTIVLNPLPSFNSANIAYFVHGLIGYFYFLQLVLLYWLVPKETIQLNNPIEEIVKDEILDDVVIEDITEEFDQEEASDEPKEEETKQEEINEEIVIEDKEIIIQKAKPKQKETFVYNEDKERQQIMKRYERMYKEGLVTKEELNKIRRENGFDKV